MQQLTCTLHHLHGVQRSPKETETHVATSPTLLPVVHSRTLTGNVNADFGRFREESRTSKSFDGLSERSPVYPKTRNQYQLK
ncbi:BZ3500_MvSof-1268-A1-R1_Chr11-3g03513 [Microbotryum saponariae]|uniref:BZ3500_MvSof-1268-A1-R1_Chr11-3g03513 protein n=1 Tax=Microbotryum saponariae TaxID=289078 RepID=A0A2X0N883_9BASI|nr:BZ3500_MvSof-1268-A1-R1_Chr11-3g03513 [Microbotryum saponariae]SDA03522.1 BZ3501_MvSof-1269-A2-R1_Chr11g03090 [Microbotryum saponariae]